MKALSLVFRIYRIFLYPAFALVFDIRCRYEESCSRYTERVLIENGMLKGAVLATKRIFSCNQWNKSMNRSMNG